MYISKCISLHACICCCRYSWCCMEINSYFMQHWKYMFDGGVCGYFRWIYIDIVIYLITVESHNGLKIFNLWIRRKPCTGNRTQWLVYDAADGMFLCRHITPISWFKTQNTMKISSYVDLIMRQNVEINDYLYAFEIW